MTTAVIEDNALQRKMTAESISQWKKEEKDSDTTDTYENAEEFLFKSYGKIYDLIFIDILMPGMNGMELARIIRQDNIPSLIVFITGESSFVFEGYKVDAMDYLMKPVKEEDIRSILVKAQERLHKPVKVFRVENEDGIRMIPIKDIYYFESDNKELRVVYKNRNNTEETSAKRTMESAVVEIENSGESNSFSFVRRGFYINFKAVSSISRKDVVLFSGEKIPMARGRKNEFIEDYFSWCRGRGKEK